MHTLGLLVALTLTRPQPTPLPLELADELDDGGVRLTQPFTPSMAVIATDGGFLLTWVDNRRHEAFDAPRGDTDVWINTFFPDGGLASPYGTIAHRAGWGEVSSQPRLAPAGPELLLAWRTSDGTDGGPASLSWGTLRSDGRVNHTQLAPGTVANTSLELTAGPSATVATWETPTSLAWWFWNAPMPAAWQRASASLGFARPSAGVSSLGALVLLWQDGTVLQGVLTPTSLTNVASAWGSNAKQPRAARFLPPSSAAALLTRPNGLMAAVGEPGVAPESLEPASDGPVFGALSTKRGHVVHRSTTGLPTLRALTPGTPVTSTAVPLPTGLQVQALASGPDFDLALALEDGADTLLLLALAGTVTSLTGAAATIARDDDQLYPSAAGLADGTWLVGRTDAPRQSNRALRVARYQGTALINGFTLPTLRAATLLSSPSGQRVGAHVVSAGSSFVALVTTDGGSLQLERTPAELTVAQELTRAALGDELALLWSPDSGQLQWSGSGGGGSRAWPRGLGACGAWTDDGVFLLPEETATTFRLVGVRTGRADAGTGPEEVDLEAALPVFGLERCLAVEGDRVLLATTHDGELRLYGGRLVGDALADAVAVRPLADGGTLPGFAPSVVPLDDGWLLAWEERTGNGVRLKYAVLDATGAVVAINVFSNPARDARRPEAVAGPAGDVMLSWHEFDEAKGRSQARWLPFPVGSGFVAAPDGGARDGGSAPQDAGLGTDAGERDAGPADGGDGDGGAPDAGGGGTDETTDLSQFASCGCAADGSLALLGLVLVAARRRPGRGGIA